ncbi:MAG TPA: hypothetical protein VLH39_05125, partial [Magnetospirillaceae bacterium]|nr:hypothetical protein [Magnetospirillaceae bacterium]
MKPSSTRPVDPGVERGRRARNYTCGWIRILPAILASSPGANTEKLARSMASVLGARNLCAGYNAWSFLKFFGGMHKGRPNAEDLVRAAAFA